MLSWILMLQIGALVVFGCFATTWIVGELARYKERVAKSENDLKLNEAALYIQSLESHRDEDNTRMLELMNEVARLKHEQTEEEARRLQMEADGYETTPVWNELTGTPPFGSSVVLETHDPLRVAVNEAQISLSPELEKLQAENRQAFIDEAANVLQVSDIPGPEDDQPYFEAQSPQQETFDLEVEPAIECGHFNWQDHPDCEHCAKRLSVFPSGRAPERSDVAENQRQRYAQWKGASSQDTRYDFTD